MKIIIFDVGNAACAIISSPNKFGLMIDCGSNNEKENPVDLYNKYKTWLNIAPFETKNRIKYELGLLHITHPDDDHVRNAKRIIEEKAPYLLQRRMLEEFPQSEQINQDYKKYLDLVYIGSNAESIPWGFDNYKTFMIPMEILRNDINLNKKIKNNSSILLYIEKYNKKILFSGDMEKDGWEWLAKNNNDFIITMKKGLDILIAPHHGHSSGFPKALFDLTGNVRMIIHSKGSEGNIEGTDVSTQYSNNCVGIEYKNLNDNLNYYGKVLTTRSNGNIYMDIGDNSCQVWTDKASSNHKRI